MTLVLRCLLLLLILATTTSLTLTTTAKSRLSKADLQEFLATPANWPKIVASSNRVTSTDVDTNKPMKAGSSVTEYFGLNLLSVSWTCEVSQPGKLVFRSPQGLAGIANNCLMEFDIGEGEVTLTMGYNPLSIISVLATPVLTIDNWAALHVFLPAAVSSIRSHSRENSR
jgi:hypothetical protein